MRFFSFVLVGVVACSTPSKQTPADTDEDPSGTLTPTTFGDAYFTAECKRTLACESDWGFVFGSMERCKAYYAPDILAYTLDPELYEVDARAAKDCFDKIENAPCEQFFFVGLDRDCKAMFTGKLGVADCCDARGGCEDDLYCPVDPEDLSDVAVCTSRAGVGDSCSDAVPCEEGATCQGVCVARAALSQSCQSAECDDGLWCDGEVCRMPLVLGAECAGEDPLECGVLACIQGVCSYRALVGDPCWEGTLCPGGTDCVGPSFPGICTERGGEDDDCEVENYFDHPDCARIETSGLFCNDVGTCERLPRRDESCAATGVCWPLEELYCSALSETCKPRLSVGTLCDTDTPGELNDPCPYATSYCDPASNQCTLAVLPDACGG